LERASLGGSSHGEEALGVTAREQPWGGKAAETTVEQPSRKPYTEPREIKAAAVCGQLPLFRFPLNRPLIMQKL
jgi:hypothetical protein